jgi:hypothetical protein
MTLNRLLRVTMLAGACFSAHAASAQTLINSCREIGQPGTYQLTTDLSGKSYDGVTCFRIKASYVTLDLGGHTIRGYSGSPSYGVIADGGATLGIRIANGIVADFGDGIWLGNTFAAVVENVQVNVNKHVGLTGGNGAVIHHVRASQNRFVGVIAGAGSYLSDVAVESSGSDGIRAGLGSRIVNCWSEFNSGYGIVMDRTLLGRASIYANTTGANGRGGISADCAGGIPQSGGGVFSGLWVTGNVNDPYFPNTGTHITANVPEVYKYTNDGVFLFDEPCQNLQAGTVVHLSGDR